ncbi:hypothetical protein GCM10023067_53900 [Aminobacter aganoensis]
MRHTAVNLLKDQAFNLSDMSAIGSVNFGSNNLVAFDEIVHLGLLGFRASKGQRVATGLVPNFLIDPDRPGVGGLKSSA